MATMVALQSSMASLTISPSSIFGRPLSPPLFSAPIKLVNRPCTIEMRFKDWKHKKCKPNSLPILHKMHVKVGDTVQLITGHEKGKVGEITRIFRHNSTVIVEGLNLKTKHMKSMEEGEPGEIVKIAAPIHSSNVMLYSKEKNVASRVGHKMLEDGSKVRYLIKTGEIIDSAENWKKIVKERKKIVKERKKKEVKSSYY